MNGGICCITMQMRFFNSPIIPVFLMSYGKGCAEEKRGGWIHYGETRFGDCYFDAKSVSIVKPTIIKVSNKVKYSEAGKDRSIKERIRDNMPTDGWEKLDYTVFYDEFNCEDKTVKTKKVVDYNDEGEILEDFDFKRSLIEIVVPKSMNDLLLKQVCHK